MIMNIVKHLKEEFYSEFCKFCDQHKFPRIHSEVLPELCFVCYLDNTPVYCVWLYRTDSKLAWLSFPISNKNIVFNQRKGGLEFLFNYVESYCKRKGVKILFTTSSTESIIESLEKQGWEIGDKNVNHYSKIL